MHYLLEHWGEVGAEQHHEQNARTAVELALKTEYAHLVIEGADEFLDSLTGLWDILDAALLQSGVVRPAQRAQRGLRLTAFGNPWSPI